LGSAIAATRAAGQLVSDPACPANVRQAYEQAALNVRFGLLDTRGSTVLVSSVDGTALAVVVASNLAILAALDGERVILVDAGVHAPELDSVFTLTTTAGFTDLIKSGAPVDITAALQTVSDVPNLQLIGVGNAGPVPGGLGRADRLRDVISQIKSAADRVILVGAPILSQVDSLDLCPHVDGVVIAVAPGRTHRLDARRARELLERVHATVLGVVLTPNR
jgi:Mrp family chromosome partitioning ATPase